MNIAIIGGGLASPKTTSRSLRIAIVGGGFTGLTAAYELSKKGHQVTVFERDDHLGGLAYGFKQSNWDWYLEAAYHHLFTNDNAIIGLIRELGLGDKLIIKRPITANLIPSSNYESNAEYTNKEKKTNSYIRTNSLFADNIVQFDSPAHLLRFPGLPMIDKLRTGALAVFCKVYPFWQSLEGITAKQFAIAIGGSHGWKTIWEPLMDAKFGKLADSVAASWLWARIHKRTPSLMYIEGGFQTLVNALATAIKKNGGKIFLDYEFNNLQSDFDKTLLTVPTPIAAKLLPHFSLLTSHFSLPLTIPHLHAQVLILETDKPLLKDVYWLSITDPSFPFLAVVQHTNFMDKKYYGGHHITYIGNYLPDGHPYLKMDKKQLFNLFLPFIKKINPNFKQQYNNITIQQFTCFYAQPVHQLHYSRVAPKLETGIPGVYLANMDSIYPWDRGTNYAVELGQKAAHTMLMKA